MYISSTRLTSLVSSRLLGPSPFAYVVNFVSNDVSGYTIDPDTGVLSPIAGPPVYARGPRSVAVDNGEFAYVANTASNLDSVSGYTIDRNTGALKDMAGLPVSVGDEPQSVAVAPSGEFAYVANGGGGVSGYTIDRTTGALKHMPASPFPAGDGPRSVAVDRSGKFAYVANFGRPSDKVPGNVSGYRIETTGALIPIGGVAAGLGPTSVAVAPSGKFAYVANSGRPSDNVLGNVSGYRIETTGALIPIGGVAAGLGPTSVAVAPSGKFAYVANFGRPSDKVPGNVSGYTINPDTGALTPMAGSPFPAGLGPRSVAVDRSGKFAYVANSGRPSDNVPGNVSGYRIETTGALTPIPGVAAGKQPYSVAVTPSPRFIISQWFSRFSHWFPFKLRPTR